MPIFLGRVLLSNEFGAELVKKMKIKDRAKLRKGRRAAEMFWVFHFVPPI